ncbi:hypothetical protein [Leptolyngbya sp. BC1307]|uniref:hypothetical protein n=1 Tax=Leptolyngbya sp. BC1307 TaxID=2029589 RepID=UPI000EFC02C5|nr:hypothetical protein [Leptolyngbya sp. BC1307]
MSKQQIIKILSNHRHAHCFSLAKPLTLNAITKLLESSLPPHHATEALKSNVYESLLELQAQGEILIGMGNQFCMAPPTVITEDKTDLIGILFKGDRAYLKLAHQALETGQPCDRTILHPKLQKFDWLEARLKNCHIRLLTVSDSVIQLLNPDCPKRSRLLGAEWPEDPFYTLQGTVNVQSYIPELGAGQWDRWQSTTRHQIADRSLLRLPTGEYLWFEEAQMYELTPDEACLAMFWLDRQMDCPILLAWDETPGRLNLQKTTLPSTYAQWLWRLSEPDENQPRTRRFQPSHRPFVCEALARLGCKLV